MRQDRAASGLTFPIKFRCTSLVDEPELEVSLTRALGGIFAKARTAWAPVLSTGGGVALQAALRCNSARAPDNAQKNRRHGHSGSGALDIGGSEAKVNVARADPDAIAVAKQPGFKVVVTPHAARK